MKNGFAVLMAILISCIGLAGCGRSTDSLIGSESRVDNLVIIAGNHANSKQGKYVAIHDKIKEVALNYGNISVIIPDGDPFVGLDIKIPEQKKGMSKSKYSDIAESQAREIEEYLYTSKDCMARSGEVNLVKAFELASRIWQTPQYQGSTEICVFDSGISTTGGIDFTRMGTDLDGFTDYTMQCIAEDALVVELKNATVRWFGLTDTSNPQPELSRRQNSIIKQIWTEYLTYCGVSTIDFMTDISSACIETTLPSVSIVEADIERVFEEKFDSNSITFIEPVSLNESSIQFIPGTATIKYEELAEAVLEDLIEILDSHEEMKILLVGSTAKYGDLQSCISLSEDRCSTVKDILVKNGIDDSRVFVRGMGFQSPYYIPDTDVTTGNLIEEKAQLNRVIIVMDYDSPEAQSILELDNPDI